jgi:transcriptional regulator GlxA family with amidase domain
MDPRIRQSIILVKEDLKCRYSSQELAARSGLTPQHFCVLFKAETGETPIAFMRRVRMDEARRLLEDQAKVSLNIKEIAVSVGCRDASHFVREFRKRFGLSPKRYRATYFSKETSKS